MYGPSRRTTRTSRAINWGHKRSGGQQHDHSHRNRSPHPQKSPGDNHTHCRDDRSEGSHIQKTKNHEAEEAGSKGRVVAPQGRVQKIPESSRERAGTRNGPHHAGQYPGEAPNHTMNNPNESRHTWTTRGSGRIHTEASEGPDTTQGRALQAPAEAGQGTDDGPQVEPQPRLRKGRQGNEAPTSQHRPGQEDWIYMHQTPRHQV